MTMDLLAAADVPEGQGGPRCRRQADRAQPRRGQCVADPALGHPRFPVAFGRQERSARCVHRERRGLLLFRAQSQCPRDQERDGAQRHPVRPVAVGGAGLDLLGHRKHDRRTRQCRRQGSGAVPHRVAGRQRQERRWRATPAQHPAGGDGHGRLRHQATAQRRRHGRRLRLVAGTGDRKLDRVRRPCRGGAVAARSRSRN